MEIIHTEGLCAYYGEKAVLHHIDLSIKEREILNIIGESGAGKSTLAHIMVGLHRVYGLEVKGIIEVRKQVALVPQNVGESLDPVFTIYKQMREIPALRKFSEGEAKRKIEESLIAVGLEDTQRILKTYPHSLSGGMKQRILIAMAIAMGSKLIVADEPTSSLDVTVSAQVLRLLKNINKNGVALILITHDFNVVKLMQGRVIVMHKGMIVEEGNAEEVMDDPLHPYTAYLLNAIPKKDMHYRRTHLQVKEISPAVKGCPYQSICEKVKKRCTEELPPLEVVGMRKVRCFYP
ncbi:MAG: ABC transporter ATP-binding protein [Deltaproteobacteria bacterium]|nr:ABC transporter ATP-binding protein [Deltaproteobacteria bacterium]